MTGSESADTGMDTAPTFSAFARYTHNCRQVENFFSSLKLKDISGLAYLAEKGDLYNDLSTELAHIFLSNN